MDDESLNDSISMQDTFHISTFSELSTEVINHIYCKCDVENTDSVLVSKLLEYIALFTTDSSLELLTLKELLDPTDTDPTINRETFDKGFTEWIFELKKHILMDNFDIAEGVSKLTVSPNVLLNKTEPSLQDQIKHLTFKNQQLTFQLDLVQNQLNICENENKNLIENSDTIKTKLVGLQQCYENLKENQKDIDISEEECIKLSADIGVLEKMSVLQLERISELSKDLEEKESNNEILESNLKNLNKDIRKRDEIISNLQEEIINKEKNIVVLDELRCELERKVNKLENLVQHYKEKNQNSKLEKNQIENDCEVGTFLNKSENIFRKECKVCKQNSETSVHDELHEDVNWKYSVSHVNTLDMEINQANKKILINKYTSVINQQKQIIEELVEKIKNNVIASKGQLSPNEKNFLELKIIDLEADSNRKYVRIVDLMEQKEQLEEQLNVNNELHSNKLQTLIDKNKNLKIENDRIQEMLFNCSNEKSKLENRNQYLESLENKYTELMKNLTETTENNRKLSEKYNELVNEKTELEKKIDYLNGVNDDKNKNNFHINRRSVKLDEKSSIDHLKEMTKNRKSIELQVDLDLNEITANDSGIYQLSNKSEKLLQKEKQVKILEKMVEYQNIELRALTNEKKRNVDQIYELKCYSDRLGKQLEELNTQYENSLKSKESFSSEVELINKLNKSLENDLKRANEICDNFQATCCPIEEYKMLINEHKLLKIEYDTTVQENKKWNTEISRSDKQILLLTNETRDLSANLGEVRIRLQDYKMAIAKIKRKIYSRKHKTCNKIEDDYIKKINQLEDANAILHTNEQKLRDQFDTVKINYSLLVNEKEKWIIERKDLNDCKEKLVRNLDQSNKENKQLEVQLQKKTQIVCEHCIKLHKEKEELHKHIKDLQYEIGLLEKEIYAPKKGNYEHMQAQLEKLKKNLEITKELLERERHNSDIFKKQNANLMIEINKIKKQTEQDVTILEDNFKEDVNKLKQEVEKLQLEKTSLHNCNSNVEQKLENANKKNDNLRSKITELFNQNSLLESKLDKVFEELKNKSNVSAKLQADLKQEGVLLELFHQKSILFQQNIDTVYNQKTILEKNLNKALNDLQKSESKYLSIRKLLVDTQSHVSGDFKNILQSKESEDKLINVERSLKICQDELFSVNVKYAESVTNLNSLKDRMNDVEFKIKKNTKLLNESLIALVKMLEKVIDVKSILDSVTSNEFGNGEKVEEILKLENQIHLTIQFLNALSTFKFTFEENCESLPIHKSKFVKKLIFKSTTTKIEYLKTEHNLEDHDRISKNCVQTENVDVEAQQEQYC